MAACHDVGKVSPTFQKKLYTAVQTLACGLPKTLVNVDPGVEKGWGHAGVSELAAKAWSVGQFVPMILGCHHGRRPQVGLMTAEGEVVGGSSWQQRRTELVDVLRREMNEDWPRLNDPLSAKVVAGLTTVADWIGSGQDFEHETGRVSDEKLKRVTGTIGYRPLKIVQNLSFQDIFGFVPNETQAGVFKHVTGPGVYVLEAPMGLGKTEAALYAAYQVLSAGRATGLYFALPTQTTSECIHVRVNQFLEKILPDDVELKKSMLVHGNAWLKQAPMGGEGAPGGSWFSYGKRGILAPFGVGTIDQALMAVMNVKHGFVRTFGLLGKVVILDEVHSYDVYTGTIQDELVKTLEKLGCTVIVLSATLTKERRQALTAKPAVSDAYPLFSVVAGNDDRVGEVVLRAPKTKNVSIETSSDDDAVLGDALRHARCGEQVLWIENTVGEAQKLYLKLVRMLGNESSMEIGLIHSRFTKSDRAEKEEYWVNLLGKKGGRERGRRGRILVGTQVLEQSLDIDADLLVTRICPIDMLLQRIGRLWRHDKTLRPASAACKAWILSPELSQALEDPEKTFGATAAVYAPYVLCRTIEAWASRSSIALPSDIRALLEATYVERDETGRFAALRNDMENGDSAGGRRRLGTRALRQLALCGLTTFAPEADDENPPSRYSERRTSDVLIVKEIGFDGVDATVTLWDGSKLVLPKESGTASAVALMRNCVSVPSFSAPAAEEKSRLGWLKGSLYVSDGEEARIRLAVVGGNNLQTLERQPLRYSYDRDVGYQVQSTTPSTSAM